MNRKKELKEKYKSMKHDMGVYIVKFKNKYYMEGSQNIKGKINGTKFKLKMGSHQNKNLQKDWNENQESDFQFEVIKKIEYDKDENKKDYTEELEIAKMIVKENLEEKGLLPY
jgi:hypothetical protein